MHGSRSYLHVVARPHHEPSGLSEEEHGTQHADDEGEAHANESGLIVKLDSHRLQVSGHCVELIRELMHVMIDCTDITLDRTDRDANITHLHRARTRDKHDNENFDTKTTDLIYNIICHVSTN